jgi:hypothetical protein
MSINRVKDPSGRARFQFEFSRRIDGQRHRARKLLPASWTRTQADAFDRQESARIYAQASGIESRNWTLDQAVARYLDGRIGELKSGNGIAAELFALQDYYTGRPPHELPAACAEIVEDYRGDLAPATIKNKLRYLCAAVRWGWKHGRLGGQNPADGVAFPAVSNERQVYIGRRDMLRLARACLNPAARAAIRVAWYSGLRLGEIERAERDFVAGVFLLADTKNGEPRIVPMHPRIRTAAAIELGTRFQTGYHFRAARAEVGLDHLHFHDLRHSAASALVNAGVNLYTVGAILGHKSRASTGRYAHIFTDTMREAIERMGRPTSSPHGQRATGPKTASSPMEARAGVEPTYSDLQSRKRA